MLPSLRAGAHAATACSSGDDTTGPCAIPRGDSGVSLAVHDSVTKWAGVPLGRSAGTNEVVAVMPTDIADGRMRGSSEATVECGCASILDGLSKEGRSGLGAAKAQ